MASNAWYPLMETSSTRHCVAMGYWARCAFTNPNAAMRTAQRLLGAMPHLSEFRNAKAVTAYLGLSPREFQSGSLRGRTRLSKAGNARLRRALYWPAIVAMTHNAPMRRFANRLLKAGKHRMLVIAAVMRKLACLTYAVLRSGRAFDFARAA